MKRIKTYKVFESKESVEDICKEYGIQNWTLNTDGTIDVDGDVNLRWKYLKKLPLKFGKVTGWFDCSFNELTSLEGCPNWIGDYFACPYNKLTSLVGGPNWVDGDFNCEGNRLLTSLEGCPEKIFGNLYCKWNNIKSLDHYPTILSGELFTHHNPIHEIWHNVLYSNTNNHGLLLTLFDLHGPILFKDGEWVCYREFLDNFFEEIGVPSPEELKNYKEV